MQSVVWLDREHAKVFDWINGVPELRKLDFSPKNHHTHRLQGDEKESRKFYHEIAQALESADAILILGPGMAKYHFRNHLAEHHPMLLKKVVGCEASDHMTEHQIAAYGANFFEERSAFENPAAIAGRATS